MKCIVNGDMEYILSMISEEQRKGFKDSNILLTGCAGALGFYLINFLTHYKEQLGIKSIIGLDNFKLGYPNWLKSFSDTDEIILREFDVVTDDISAVEMANEATHIYHMASVASPTFYRKYPIETIDANIWGLRKLLDFYRDKAVKGFVFFSSSEIYGNPSPENIPTNEEYRGRVACIGPRACYDEAKRFGETMCYLYNQAYKMPITIVRPFNTYGPGMRLTDRRVVADFAKAVIEKRDIVMYSDGTSTRTFCYVSDAISGYIKALAYGRFDVFNIGMDTPEISVKQLAEIYSAVGGRVLGYSGSIKALVSDDKEYLTDNPSRRCPDISKARSLLGYAPKTTVEAGVERFLNFLAAGKEGEWVW